MEMFRSPFLVTVQGVSVAFRVKRLGTFYNHTVYNLEAQRLPVPELGEIEDLNIVSVRTGNSCSRRQRHENCECMFFEEQSFIHEDQTCTINISVEKLDDQAVKIWGSVVE